MFLNEEIFSIKIFLFYCDFKYVLWFMQAHQQQMVQQMPQTPGSQSSNQSLSQADIDALGFSLDFGNGIYYNYFLKYICNRTYWQKCFFFSFRELKYSSAYFERLCSVFFLSFFYFIYFEDMASNIKIVFMLMQKLKKSKHVQYGTPNLARRDSGYSEFQNFLDFGSQLKMINEDSESVVNSSPLSLKIKC